MLIIWAAINVMFAGMLALLGKQSEDIKGAKQWALGDLLIGLSFALCSQLTMPVQTYVIVCASLGIGAGLGLLYNGIQAFRGQTCSYWIPLVLALALLANNYWLTAIEREPKLRILINFGLFFLIHLVCARALLRRIDVPLKTPYWLAGTAFALVAVLCVARIVNILYLERHSVSMFSSNGVNPYVFFFASMAQMAMSMAFMLLINTSLANRLKELAATDALTGLMNRRSLDQEIARQLASQKRHNDNLSLMMIDVDHFKQLNDQYGHQAGDEVLRRLAALMQNLVRSNDYIGRYGGEEFCIVLPATSESQAMVLAERIRIAFQDLNICWEKQTINSSISIGVADTWYDNHQAASLLKAADIALYQAKHQGRNQVVGFSASRTLTETSLRRA